MQKYFNSVIKPNGRPAVSANVAVTDYPGGSDSTIYVDDGVTPVVGNDLTTDQYGYFEFYAADGRYTLTISGGDIVTTTIDDVLLEDPADGNAIIVSGGTVDNSVIGGTTPAAGTFTTLIGTTIDGVIGSVTPAAGTFTTLEAGTSAIIGSTTVSPDGTLHVHTATAGAVTANAAADDLVVENTTGTGISILGGDGFNSYLAFGSPSAAIGAEVRWVYSSGAMILGTRKAGATVTIKSGNQGDAVTIDSGQNVVTEQSIYIKEKAAANGDTAGQGQLWVKNTTPCQLWFTDDAGTDTQIV